MSKQLSMKSLEIQDQHHLRAAEGWLELGNHIEAANEIENISFAERNHPDVLEVRWLIYAKAQKWDVCLDLARAITKLAPDRPFGWVHLAYSLRRATDGSLEAALETLVPVVDQFPKIWMMPFNLACYCSQLGRLDEAQEWFKKAMAIDEQTVKRAGIEEPDLKPLWDSMSGTLWKKE